MHTYEHPYIHTYTGKALLNYEEDTIVDILFLILNMYGKKRQIC